MVLRQHFIHAALELGIEAENARICERQDLRHYNARDVLRRIDPEIVRPAQPKTGCRRFFQPDLAADLSRSSGPT